jgi:hypothetical protein
MRTLLAVGSALATAVIVHKRRAARSRHQQQHGKPLEPALVHAYPSYAAQQQHILAMKQLPSSSPTPVSSEASMPSMRGAWSSLLLLLSMALALGSVALLVARGQGDAAATVALTWLLAAPAILALGKQSAQRQQSMQQQQQQQQQQGMQEDAVMVVEDGASDFSSQQRLAQPTQDVMDAFHGTWIKVGVFVCGASWCVDELHPPGPWKPAVVWCPLMAVCAVPNTLAGRCRFGEHGGGDASDPLEPGHAPGCQAHPRRAAARRTGCVSLCRVQRHLLVQGVRLMVGAACGGA